jgi:outer membrane lipoprotein-sorting protein
MSKNILNWTIAIVISAGNICLAQGCAEVSEAKGPPKQASGLNKQQKSQLDGTLEKLSERAQTLQSYQCDLEYLFSQPLFDSQTLRMGKMYYLRDGRDSMLRIDFNTEKQDEEPAVEYIENWVFDGIWLTRVNHELKQVKMYQLIDPNEFDPNESVDAFDLITEYLPIVGFTKTERLEEEFNIELAEGKSGAPIELNMKVKPESIYADDYTSIDFSIDRKLYLPVSVTAYSTEEDIYQFRFIEPKVNEGLERKTFKLDIPKDFPKPEVVPLKKN